MEPFYGVNPRVFEELIFEEMLFPSDDETRFKYSMAAVGKRIINAAAVISHDELAPIFSHPSVWYALQEAGKIERYDRDTENGTRDGEIAAKILHYALSLRRHMPRLQGINNAVRIVMKENGLGKSSVMAAWGRAKTVSHLWAAHIFGPHPLPCTFHDPAGFERFLAVAEAYRCAGEKAAASGARSPFLEPEKQAEFAWVKPAILVFPDLEEWMNKAVGSH